MPLMSDQLPVVSALNSDQSFIQPAPTGRDRSSANRQRGSWLVRGLGLNLALTLAIIPAVFVSPGVSAQHESKAEAAQAAQQPAAAQPGAGTQAGDKAAVEALIAKGDS